MEQSARDGGLAQTDQAYDLAYAVEGAVGPGGLVRHSEDDDFVQAGALYRAMREDERARLAENIAGSLAQVSRQDVIARSLEHFRKADAEYGQRVADAVARVRQGAKP